MTRYPLLRLWSSIFLVLGIVVLIGTAIGIIVAMFEAESLWQGLVVLFIGGPVGLLLATWPIAFSQLARAVADTGDAVAGLR